jgi:predicted phage terminase large subunit-like protein
MSVKLISPPKITAEQKEAIKRAAKIELARRDFWEFCKVKAPDFYADSREHLIKLCTTLDDFYNGRLLKADGSAYKKLMINMPPRHGKTRTLVNFCEWILGKDNAERIISCSYNDDMASDFSRYTRDGIDQEKNIASDIVFSDIFPDTKIKEGHASYQKWALRGQFFNYLGAGVGSGITGRGGTLLLVDDPVKGAEEALNENHLDKLWIWYTSTFLSRVSAEQGEPLEIIVMTRWSKKDICGRILESSDKASWYVLKMEAYNKKADQMLCSDMLSKKRYFNLRSQMVDMIFEANYHQKPIDLTGTLYKKFKTYDKLPEGIKRILSYTDTADTGKDYLCSIVFGEYNGEAYIIDVFYTQEGMEVTEPAAAKFLYENKVNLAQIESNNGGRGFARAVQRLLLENHKSRTPIIKWFSQTKNKQARIFAASAFVMEHIYFPVNWKDRWPGYYEAMISYQKEGKNKHDDAQDATTGVYEMVSKTKTFEFV